MERDTERMLKVINEDPEISCYDIEKIFKKSYERLFRRATGFYANNSAIYGISERYFKMDYNTTVEANVEKFHKLLEDKKISLEEFTLYYHNSSFAGKIYGNRERGFSTSGNMVDNLVFFLRNIDSGKPDKDYKETYEFTASNNLQYNTEKFKFTIGTCTIERFKNSTIKFTYGNTKANHEKIIDKILRLKEINDLLSR